MPSLHGSFQEASQKEHCGQRETPPLFLGEAGAGKTFFRGYVKWSSRGRAPGVCCVAERGPAPVSAADLEEPVLLRPPEGLGGSRGSGWGCSCDSRCISYRFHTQLMCVTGLLWTEGLR